MVFARETKQVFLTTVPSRDKNTLLPILKKKIKPGTTIISDCWKSYDCLSQEDFEHLTINHSVNFVDTQSGCHTQNIENLWWQVKRQLPDTYTRHNQLYLHLAEYLWRNMKRKDKDIFKVFLKDASKYYSGPKCNSFYIYICVFYIKIRHFQLKIFFTFCTCRDIKVTTTWLLYGTRFEVIDFLVDYYFQRMDAITENDTFVAWLHNSY